METIIMIATAFWGVLCDMAPYLLFGFFSAGILSLLFTPEFVARHLGGRGASPVLKAALLGIPLPLCSCGVIPVAASLRRQGASKGATAAFLLSTPTTGPDSILVTWSLLGPVFALARPLVALITGFAGGMAITTLAEDKESATRSIQPDAAGDQLPPPALGWAGKLRAGLRHGFVTIPGDLGWALAIGILVAGVIAVLVPPQALGALREHQALSMLAALALGIPLYVCATASVPMAAALIHAGLSPGSALVFLMVGPDTNAALIGSLWRMLGPRSTMLYLATLAITALGAGLLLDYAFVNLAIPALAHQHGAAGIPWYSQLAAGALLLVLANAVWPRGVVGKAVVQSANECACHSEGNACGSSAGAAKVRLAVSGMHCAGCATHVQEAMLAVKGVIKAKAWPEVGEALAEGDGIDADALGRAVSAAGYPASVKDAG